MLFDEVISELKDVDGYLASAIMRFGGEILASHSNSPKIDLNVVGESFNTLFRTGHKVVGQVGFEALEESILVTPSGIIVMACSGEHSTHHLHFITVLTKDGNRALAKLIMEKAVKKVNAS